MGLDETLDGAASFIFKKGFIAIFVGYMILIKDARP